MAGLYPRRLGRAGPQNDGDEEEEEQEDDDDPVEHLSRLQLELYHCLSTVKSVEKMKKERLRRCTPEEPPLKNAGGNTDTSWSENLFHATERFIEALRAYVGAGPGGGIRDMSATEGRSANPSPTVDSEQQRQQQQKGMEIDSSHSHSTTKRRGRSSSFSGYGSGSVSHIDTATGLMIISCYTRLVQIFDVVVSVVETYKEMNCPDNYVQLRFGGMGGGGGGGGFAAADRALQARVLGQYVLHLLEGVSEAVERVTASKRLYARAVLEVRSKEAKLKERILTALYSK